MQTSKEIEATLNSKEFYRSVEKIGLDHGLDLDGVGYLQFATSRALTGDIPKSSIASTLLEDVVMDKNAAELIASEVIEKVIAPLEKFMTKNTPSVPENLPMLPDGHELLAKNADVGAIAKPADFPIPDSPTSQRRPPSIIDTRLGGSIRLPREEVNLNSDKKQDPYREPI